MPPSPPAIAQEADGQGEQGGDDSAYGQVAFIDGQSGQAVELGKDVELRACGEAE
jgi:hypothetical protein